MSCEPTKDVWWCRTAALHENFVARLQILTDLHWSQRRPLSAAETRFSARVLPELEDTAAALQRDVRVRVWHAHSSRIM